MPCLKKRSDKIYIAPSGVQKERIQSDEIFVVDAEGNILESPPKSANLRLSACTPLFMVSRLHFSETLKLWLLIVLCVFITSAARYYVSPALLWSPIHPYLAFFL